MKNQDADTTLKERIYNMILAHDGSVSFAMLHLLDGFDGEHRMGYDGLNVWLWTDMSSEAIRALRELVREGKIHMRQTDRLTYVLDGMYLPWPEPKRARHSYKNPRWLPVCLHLGPLSENEGPQGGEERE